MDRLDEPQFAGLRHGLRAGPDVQFFIDVADVGVDRRIADVQLFGDLAVEKSLGEAVDHLGGQAADVLPMLVRGFYYDNWKPAATPIKIKTAQEFYDAVRENFAADRNVNPMRLTEAVLKVLSTHTSPGELEKVLRIFPPVGPLAFTSRSISSDVYTLG